MKLKYTRSVFATFTISFSVLILLTFTVITALYYMLFDQNYTEAIQSAHKSSINYENERFDEQVTRRVQGYLSDINMDTTYRELPVSSSGSYDLVSAFRIFQDLTEYYGQRSQCLLDILLIYPEQKTCLSARNGLKISNTRNEDYQKFISGVTDSRIVLPAWSTFPAEATGIWTNNSAEDPDSSICYTAVPVWNQGRGGSVLISFVIRKSYLRHVFGSIATGNQVLCLLDDKNEVICASDEEAIARITNLSGLLQELPANPDEINTLESNAQIYSVCELSGLPFRLLIVTPAEEWKGNINTISRTILIIGLAGLAVALLAIFLLTRWLYSPVRMITDFVHQLPSIPSRSFKNEFSLIENGITEMSRLLGNTQRVIISNQSLLKNQALLDLMDGTNGSDALDTLRYLNIPITGKLFAMIGVEFCEADAAHLDQDAHRALQFALMDKIEKLCTERSVASATGFVPENNLICFLFAAAETNTELLNTCNQSILDFFGKRSIRCYLVNTTFMSGSVQSLPALYQQTRGLLNSRLFDMRPDTVHLSAPMGEDNAFLNDRLSALSRMTDAAPGQVCQLLAEISYALQDMNPFLARQYLQRCITILRNIWGTLRSHIPLPALLTDIQNQIWRIDELEQRVAEALSLPKEEADGSDTDDMLFLQKVSRYIQDHLQEEITLESVGEALYFNAQYFSRKFKKTAGLSFSTYVNNCRLEKAVSLLNRTDLTVAAIAESTGYNNVQYFMRKFREVYHTSPGEFRKNAGNRTEPVNDTTEEETENHE